MQGHQKGEIVSKAINYFKKYNPNDILIVSYSDPMQNHKGGIYQATNWIYVGRGPKDKMVEDTIQRIFQTSAEDTTICGSLGKEQD